MNAFSPQAIFERGRQKTAANQPQYEARLRQMIETGLAMCLSREGRAHWFVCAPSSRLEAGVFLARDLSVEGEAGEYRIEFEQIDFTHDTWGWLLVGGFPVADFRPLAESEDEHLVTLWNSRSGRPPVQLVDF